MIAGRLRAIISAGMRHKPPGEFCQTAGEGGKSAWLVCGNTPLIGRGTVGNDKLFVDIGSAADLMDDF